MNVDIQKLIEARVLCGMTLEEVAKKCDMSRQTLWRIENKMSKPRAKTLNKLCDVYGRMPNYFFKKEA